MVIIVKKYTAGEIIKQMRIRKGLTQDQLADILGLNKSSIQKYESGSVQNLKFDTIRELCTLLNFAPWMLIYPEFVDESILEAHTKLDIKSFYILNEKGTEKFYDYFRDLIRIEEYVKKKNEDIGKHPHCCSDSASPHSETWSEEGTV